MEKFIKAKNNESGTLTALLSVAETSTAHVTPVPAQAPGFITIDIGTADEEEIYYETRDDVAGTISTLTRDTSNLNGGTGIEHQNGAPWETAQSATYINQMVDGIKAEHNTDGTHKETALDSMIAGTEAQGDVIYHNGTIWTRLAAGTSGQFLQTQGSSANPQWATAAAADGWTAAGETWTYAAADDPTFTFTIAGDKTGKYSPGMRIKLTQTTAKYFIVTAVSYSDPNTTVTVYGGTDYDLANAAITSPFFSMEKAPLSFPLDPTKWTVETTDTSDRSQGSAVAGTWYNAGTITQSIPIGIWRTQYQATIGVNHSGTDRNVSITLSTANNSQSDADLSAAIALPSPNAAYNPIITVSREKVLVLAAKTSHYLNIKTDTASTTSINIRGDFVKTIIRSVSAYL